MKTLEDGLKEVGFDHVDLWRITCHEPGRQHTFGEAFEFVEAAEQAIKDGKCRFFGISSHDRRWLELMVASFPEISVVLTPYTAKSKEKPQESFFDTIRKQDVGLFGIKPFASNALFKGDSQPGNPHEKEDNENARMALRYILSNDAITAPIPGLITAAQVDNCLEAIAERRKLDLQASRPAILQDQRLAAAADEMWERLPPDYQWLKDWEWV
jgi:aryl-alcohol dehydrogenase-like predicted oxidoreductase